MKRFTPLVVIILAAMYISVTGFQCGSAETTTAKLAMQQKDWKKAEESLMKEVAKNDKNEEAWFMLGQVRSELKKYIEMNDAFSRALAVGSTYKAEIDRYKLAAWAANYNDGITSYNKGKDDPTNYDKALESFRIAMAMAPDTSGTYYVAGLAAYAKKDYPKASEYLNQCLAKAPNRVDAARLLGDLHMSQASMKVEAKDQNGAVAEYKMAAEAFNRAYQAEPTEPDNINKLIAAYELSKQEDKVIQLTADCIKATPNNRLCRYAYGLYLIKKEQFEDGITQFKTMIEIEPDNKDDMYKDAMYNVGVAYQNWGVALKAESDKKVEASKGKLKDDPIFKEKFKSALYHFEKVVEFKKDDPTIYQALGRLYANLNMTKEAKAAFETADKLLKGN